MRKNRTDWSVLRYLAYFTQVGVTMITPPVLFCFGALWLKRRFGWGNGVMLVAILLGIGVAACGVRDILRLTERKARKSEEERKRL